MQCGDGQAHRAISGLYRRMDGDNVAHFSSRRSPVFSFSSTSALSLYIAKISIHFSMLSKAWICFLVCSISNVDAQVEYCVAHASKCTNGGLCISSADGGYSCDCKPGYYGVHCEKKYCGAHPNQCKNKGVCSSTLSGRFYTCRCKPGYYGYTCEKKYCNAHPNPCENKGVCFSTLSGRFYTCRCKPGYYGNNCETHISIDSPDTVAVLLGSPVSITALVQTNKAEVLVSVWQGGKMIENKTRDGSGPVKFTLGPIDSRQVEAYVFSARPVSLPFTAKDSTYITVNVMATITTPNETKIMAPVTMEGDSEVLCRADGSPSPRVKWLYNGTVLGTGPTSLRGVYQSVGSASATLFIGMAKVTDAGNYTCKATNKVGKQKSEIIAMKMINLSVISKPIISSMEAKPCYNGGCATITWSQKNPEIQVKHRIHLQSVNSTISHNLSIITEKQTVSFEALFPATLYKLQVTPCPRGCIESLATTAEISTFGELSELRSELLTIVLSALTGFAFLVAISCCLWGFILRRRLLVVTAVKQGSEKSYLELYETSGYENPGLKNLDGKIQDVQYEGTTLSQDSTDPQKMYENLVQDAQYEAPLCCSNHTDGVKHADRGMMADDNLYDIAN